MSKALAGLSQYGDSDSDDDAVTHAQSDPGSTVTGRAEQGPHETDIRAAAAPSRRKRKLPPLDLDADGLQQDSSRSSSAKGAHRSTVVKGAWLCYCFVQVLVDPSLSRCIQESHTLLQQQLGPEHTLLDLRYPNNSTEDAQSPAVPPSQQASKEQLHISLIRPFTVRSYERDEYVKVAAAEVHRLKASVGSFPFTFSRIAHLANDDASRHFMVLEVGAGRDQLHRLSTALSTELRRAFRAKSYYDEARFHASTACVLDTPPLGQEDGGETAHSLASRLGTIIAEVEAQLGPQLRQCRQVWATRVGIQVANRVTYVDL